MSRILYPRGPAARAPGLQPRTGAADPLKPWRTGQARATLAGFTAHLTQTDEGNPELILSRWALSRSFTDLAELDAWLQRVGAPS